MFCIRFARCSPFLATPFRPPSNGLKARRDLERGRLETTAAFRAEAPQGAVFVSANASHRRAVEFPCRHSGAARTLDLTSSQFPGPEAKRDHVSKIRHRRQADYDLGRRGRILQRVSPASFPIRPLADADGQTVPDPLPDHAW